MTRTFESKDVSCEVINIIKNLGGNGIKQTEISKITNLSQSTISKILSGKTSFTRKLYGRKPIVGCEEFAKIKKEILSDRKVKNKVLAEKLLTSLVK